MLDLAPPSSSTAQLRLSLDKRQAAQILGTGEEDVEDENRQLILPAAAPSADRSALKSE